MYQIERIYHSEKENSSYHVNCSAMTWISLQSLQTPVNRYSPSNNPDIKTNVFPEKQEAA